MSSFVDSTALALTMLMRLFQVYFLSISLLIGKTYAVPQKKCMEQVQFLLSSKYSKLYPHEKILVYALFPMIKKRLRKDLQILCKGVPNCLQVKKPEIFKLIEEVLVHYLNKMRLYQGRSLTGILTIVCAMLSYITVKNIPQSMKILSQLIASICVLVTYSFGARLLDPIRSGIRKLGFVIEKSDDIVKPVHDPTLLRYLEGMWDDTQRYFSLNAQMSRNVVESYIRSSQANWHQAYNLLKQGDVGQAEQEVALSLIRLFQEHPDINYLNQVVQRNTKSFTTFFKDKAQWEKFKKGVIEKVQADLTDFNPGAIERARETLDHWRPKDL